MSGIAECADTVNVNENGKTKFGIVRVGRYFQTKLKGRTQYALTDFRLLLLLEPN